MSDDLYSIEDDNIDEILGEFFLDLPADNRLAFIEFNKRVKNAILSRADGDATSRYEREYVNYLVAFIRCFDVEINVDFIDIPIDDTEEFYSWFRGFKQEIDYKVVEFSAQIARERRKPNLLYTVNVSSGYKEEIHGLIGKIRTIVDSEIEDEAKKNAIFDKLASLQSEIDRARTRYSVFLSRMIETATAINEAAGSSDATAKFMSRILAALGRAKREEGSPQVSHSGGARKQIAGPPENAEADGDGSDNDVEI